MNNTQQEHVITCGRVTITHLVIGPIQTNVYVVSNNEGTFVVDPAENAARIMQAVNATPCAHLNSLVVTHAHFDHTGALAALRAQTNACVIASALDAPSIENPHKEPTSPLPAVKPCVVNRAVNDGDVLEMCGVKWQVLLTPGHTKGSMCLYASAQECGTNFGILFSGDTLFRGTHGRTDFEGGSAAAMKQSLERLSTLPNNTRVFPGHMEFSEIGAEHHGVFAQIR